MNEQNFTYTSLVHTDIMLGTGQKVLGGGPEERGGGLSVFEPLERGGSFDFQWQAGVGHSISKQK